MDPPFTDYDPLHGDFLAAQVERSAAEQVRRHYELLNGTVYHLKNTLSAASEYIQLLDLDTELTDPQRDFVARSRRSIGTALRLLTELHELGRADAGELVPDSVPLNLSALLRELLQDHRLAAGATNLSFETDIPDQLLLNTDADCVRQIVDTLLSNAVRYSPGDGTVALRVRVQPGRRAEDPRSWVRIDVGDSGPGVSEQDEVFEEVRRVARKGPPGFRLAISRRVARLMGGDLTLHTEPGTGATFSLWLPLTHTAPDDAAV